MDKFQDVKVRQAINWAVDKEGIIKSVLFGHGEVPTTFLPKMRDADTQTAPYGYDVAKAKQLMSESKFPQGFKSKLTVSSGDTIGAAGCRHRQGAAGRDRHRRRGAAAREQHPIRPARHG